MTHPNTIPVETIDAAIARCQFEGGLAASGLHGEFGASRFTRDYLRMMGDLVDIPEYRDVVRAGFSLIPEMQGVEFDPLTDQQEGRFSHQVARNVWGGTRVPDEIAASRREWAERWGIPYDDDEGFTVWNQTDALEYVSVLKRFVRRYGRDVLDDPVVNRLSGETYTVREATFRLVSWAFNAVDASDLGLLEVPEFNPNQTSWSGVMRDGYDALWHPPANLFEPRKVPSDEVINEVLLAQGDYPSGLTMTMATIIGRQRELDAHAGTAVNKDAAIAHYGNQASAVQAFNDFIELFSSEQGDPRTWQHIERCRELVHEMPPRILELFRWDDENFFVPAIDRDPETGRPRQVRLLSSVPAETLAFPEMYRRFGAALSYRDAVGSIVLRMCDADFMTAAGIRPISEKYRECEGRNTAYQGAGVVWPAMQGTFTAGLELAVMDEVAHALLGERVMPALARAGNFPELFPLKSNNVGYRRVEAFSPNNALHYAIYRYSLRTSNIKNAREWAILNRVPFEQRWAHRTAYRSIPIPAKALDAAGLYIEAEQPPSPDQGWTASLARRAVETLAQPVRPAVGWRKDVVKAALGKMNETRSAADDPYDREYKLDLQSGIKHGRRRAQLIGGMTLR